MTFYFVITAGLLEKLHHTHNCEPDGKLTYALQK